MKPAATSEPMRDTTAITMDTISTMIAVSLDLSCRPAFLRPELNLSLIMITEPSEVERIQKSESWRFQLVAVPARAETKRIARR